MKFLFYFSVAHSRCSGIETLWGNYDQAIKAVTLLFLPGSRRFSLLRPMVRLPSRSRSIKVKNLSGTTNCLAISTLLAFHLYRKVFLKSKLPSWCWWVVWCHPWKDRRDPNCIPSPLPKGKRFVASWVSLGVNTFLGLREARCWEFGVWELHLNLNHPRKRRSCIITGWMSLCIAVCRPLPPLLRLPT